MFAFILIIAAVVTGVTVAKKDMEQVHSCQVMCSHRQMKIIEDKCHCQSVDGWKLMEKSE